jgi:hypothetical protein
MQHILSFYTRHTYIKNSIFQVFISVSLINTIKSFRGNNSANLGDVSFDFGQTAIMMNNMPTFVLYWVERFVGRCENILQNFVLKN